MEISLIKVDLKETYEAIKLAVKDVDRRLLAFCGCVIGSYAVYEALEYISMSGKSKNTLISKMHRALRSYYNCGILMRLRHFYFDSSFAIVNYGSYGVLPKPILHYKRNLQREMEDCPDVWFLLKLRTKWFESSTTVANALGANPENLVFVHNVTEGLNCVIRSVVLTSNDTVLITNHTYGAIRNTVDYYTSKVGAKFITLDIPFPIKSEKQVCEFYREILAKNPDIKLAVIDHITSSSALLMPVRDIVEVCKKYGVLTLIDGAHAPGQIPLQIENIGADYYAGNLHKWYFAPRGCAFLWAKSEFLPSIDPSLVSHSYKLGFKDRFFKQGTNDYTNYMAGAFAVSEYYPSIGGMEHVYKTNVPLKFWAAKLFRETWGTDSPVIPSTMHAPFMEIVRMPDSIIKHYKATPDSANNCKQELMEKYRVVMMVSAVNDALYCRVSCQICSTKEEYRRAAIAVKQFAENLDN